MHKMLTALAVAATMTIAAVAAPNQAEARWRGRHIGAGILGGFAAGAIIGSLANRGYYGPGYDYGYYDQGYYAPGPYGYEPGPVYVAPPRYYRPGGCWIETDKDRGFGYYGPCR